MTNKPLQIFLMAGLGGDFTLSMRDEFIRACRSLGHDATVLTGKLEEIGNQDYDAIITPGNSYGHMTGGFDKAVVELLGERVDVLVRERIIEDYCCELNVGDAIIVSDGTSPITHVVYAPTMRSPKKLVFGNDIPYMATLAALQVISRFNRTASEEDQIYSVIMPLMGTTTGEVPAMTALYQQIAAIHRYTYHRLPVDHLFRDGRNCDERIAATWTSRF